MSQWLTIKHKQVRVTVMNKENINCNWKRNADTRLVLSLAVPEGTAWMLADPGRPWTAQHPFFQHPPFQETQTEAETIFPKTVQKIRICF
jgi:hypothetical protein